MQNPTRLQPKIQFPQARRPGLVTIRSGGSRERGNCWRQVRALVVEADGSARVVALSHVPGAGAYRPAAQYLFGAMREGVRRAA
jgi:hypothetical protein